jgi:hypothetical protein
MIQHAFSSTAHLFPIKTSQARAFLPFSPLTAQILACTQSILKPNTVLKTLNLELSKK